MKNDTYFPLIFIALLLIGAPFFFLGGPGYHASRSYQSAWDLGHILYFLILSCWLAGLLRRKNAERSLCSIFLLTLLIVFCAGFSVEVLQMSRSGRSPDVFDLLRNQLGCLAAFAFFIQPPPFTRQWQQILFRGIVLILLAITIWPLSRSLIDEHLAGKQFPVLADFETPFERYRWVNVQQMRGQRERVRHGEQAMRVQLSTAKYSGVSLFYFPGDWRGYQTLHCSVYNPQAASLVLNIRIHDALHKEQGSEFSDRFNQQFTLQQGWNDLVISLEKVKNAPKGRAMEMEHIEGFGLFVVQQADPLEIYLDHVYLGK